MEKNQVPLLSLTMSAVRLGATPTHARGLRQKAQGDHEFFAEDFAGSGWR